MNRLHKEGSNADEPTNINLSDYSSDEGDTSSESSEEIGSSHRKQWVTPPATPPAPPPSSPVLPRRDGGQPWRSRLAGTSVIEKSSTPPREMLKIKQANIHMDNILTTDGDTDLCETVLDIDSDNSCRQTSKLPTKCSEKCNMPPELMVTPAQVYDGQVPIEMLEKLTIKDKIEDSGNACADIGPSADRYRPRSWHHLRCSPTKSSQRYMSDLASELQNKIGSTLRQKMWTGIPCVCHSSETDSHWSRSSNWQQQQQQQPQQHLGQRLEESSAAEVSIGRIASPARYLYSEHLLQSCSEKLESLQRLERTGLRHEGIHRSKPTKHRTIRKQFCFVTSSSFDERDHTLLKHSKTCSFGESLDYPEMKRSKAKEHLPRNPGKSLRHKDKVGAAEDSFKNETIVGITTHSKVKKSVKAKIKCMDVDLKASQEKQKKSGKELGKLRGVKRIKHKAKKEVDIGTLTEREIQKQNEEMANLDYLQEKDNFVPSEINRINEPPVGRLLAVDGTADLNQIESTFKESNVITVPEDIPIASVPKEKKKRSLKWKFRKSVLVAASLGSILSGPSEDTGKCTLLAKNCRKQQKICRKKDATNESAKKS